MDKDAFMKELEAHLQAKFSTDFEHASDYEKYGALSSLVMTKVQEEWVASRNKDRKIRNEYYFSAEFLVGRSLGNNLLNLGILDEVKEVLLSMGVDFEDLEDQEEDAALGNGGLGRLAACFIDSAASMGLPVQGYGVRYSQGIFKQKFVDGFQRELGDDWLRRGDFWSIRKDKYARPVRFRDEAVMAVPYDMPIVGFKNGVVNTLRLWQAEPIDSGFNFDLFNNFQYSDAIAGMNRARDITRVLYPNDIQRAGKVLRLKQQYFFTSASIQDLVIRYKKNFPEDPKFDHFSDMTAIQLNDTHPVIAIPELMRILIDEEGLSWDRAYEIAGQTFAFTNHTVLQEALEKWPLDIVDEVSPRCLTLMKEIDAKMVSELEVHHGIGEEDLGPYRIIHDGIVEMAYLAVWMSTSVNGVAQIHTSILKAETLAQWFKLFPKKFNNKTNGVTPRRWLMYANPDLAEFISRKLGSDDWHHDLTLLKGLERYMDDEETLEELNAIKYRRKQDLADYILRTEGIEVDPDSIFDIQIKRLHEYKRQLLNALHILYLYNQLKKNPGMDMVPRTFIFGAKAAPGYFQAKAIIKFINEIAHTVNADPDTRDKLRVVFLQNYRVSSAEKLFPAADVSEQISTAGKEASGTGCMKFMMNATPTLGTYDGANIEIFREAGEENNYRFGATVEELNSIADSYNPKEYYFKDREIKQVVDALLDDRNFHDNGTFMFLDIYNSLVKPQHGERGDQYYVLYDFRKYLEAQEKIDRDYRDRLGWARKCLANLANSGYFSSDRTIREYAHEIWKINPMEG
ncbi:glycogen/starch/alpha-glucan phosphorylase [Kallipyga massiliensis]|uniref:glycogen/starch/alpha-glucan phosphorylase n=1 Tax=Kallipyga massiliensis TaxID=1472764 RepID=UPI0026EDFE78|nr:glycogen/starch/alpha-glucan phosphorylase [Kallipyga massiliensis]